MKKLYNIPQTEVALTTLEATFLDHFASQPEGEDDEFNSKKRSDFDEEESLDEFQQIEQTENSLW